MSEPIVTEPFRVPRRVYESYVARRWAARYWWTIAIPVAAAATAAALTGDVRWVLVSLMYLFIITPGIISMAYFRYLLTPAARLTALEKRLVIVPGREVRIEYVADEQSSRASLPPNETMAWESVKDIRYSGRYYVIRLAPRPYPRFLLVPRAAVPVTLVMP